MWWGENLVPVSEVPYTVSKPKLTREERWFVSTTPKLRIKEERPELYEKLYGKKGTS